MSEQEFTDDEIAEFADDLIETLGEIQEAVEIAIPKAEELLEGEISYEEYCEWVEDNENTLNQIDY